MAEAATISRTTADRYFPNQRALLAAAHPETAMTSLLPDDPPDDVETRLDLVVDAFTELLLATEAQQRTMLRLSLGPDPAAASDLPLRQGRVIPWIEEALEPLRDRMSQADVHRLALAVRSATGIEALVWLTDVAGLSREEAVDLMRWSARGQLRIAMAGRTPEPGAERPSGSRPRVCQDPPRPESGVKGHPLRS